MHLDSYNNIKNLLHSTYRVPLIVRTASVASSWRKKSITIPSTGNDERGEKERERAVHIWTSRQSECRLGKTKDFERFNLPRHSLFSFIFLLSLLTFFLCEPLVVCSSPLPSRLLPFLSFYVSSPYSYHTIRARPSCSVASLQRQRSSAASTNSHEN